MFNWQAMILNLRNAGFSYERIALQCDLDPSTIGHLARHEQKEPKFTGGLRLIDLHYKHCKDKHTQDRLLYA